MPSWSSYVFPVFWFDHAVPSRFYFHCRCAPLHSIFFFNLVKEKQKNLIKNVFRFRWIYFSPSWEEGGRGRWWQGNYTRSTWWIRFQLSDVQAGALCRCCLSPLPFRFPVQRFILVPSRAWRRESVFRAGDEGKISSLEVTVSQLRATRSTSFILPYTFNAIFPPFKKKTTIQLPNKQSQNQVLLLLLLFNCARAKKKFVF